MKPKATDDRPMRVRHGLETKPSYIATLENDNSNLLIRPKKKYLLINMYSSYSIQPIDNFNVSEGNLSLNTND